MITVYHMEIGLKSKQVALVWHSDLDAYIERHLGRTWKLQQENGCYSQDTLRVLEVEPDPEATAKVQAWLASPTPEYNIWTRDEDISTETLLSELCNRGLLPEGDLHVHIWW